MLGTPSGRIASIMVRLPPSVQSSGEAGMALLAYLAFARFEKSSLP